jgi:hypothetical protein
MGQGVAPPKDVGAGWVLVMREVNVNLSRSNHILFGYVPVVPAAGVGPCVALSTEFWREIGGSFFEVFRGFSRFFEVGFSRVFEVFSRFFEVFRGFSGFST